MKPNKNEIIVMTIMISMVIGFVLGVSSMSPQIKEKDQQITELIEVTEDLLNRVEFPNNTNHPLNFHKIEIDK